jgi:hypothetical protein
VRFDSLCCVGATAQRAPPLGVIFLRFRFLSSPQILIKKFFELVVYRDFHFLAAFFPEPDVRERGMLQLRVIDRSDRGRNFAAKQSVQRIEDEYGLNANLFGPQPSKPL